MVKNIDVLIIDTRSLLEVDNRNHNDVDDTILLHKRLQLKKTVMTHIGHDLDVLLSVEKVQLPEGLSAGHDGCIAYP
jgi:phosphoribosyl 1,2-cyclic phosphate phosphodiesterase